MPNVRVVESRFSCVVCCPMIFLVSHVDRCTGFQCETLLDIVECFSAINGCEDTGLTQLILLSYGVFVIALGFGVKISFVEQPPQLIG